MKNKINSKYYDNCLLLINLSSIIVNRQNLIFNRCFDTHGNRLCHFRLDFKCISLTNRNFQLFLFSCDRVNSIQLKFTVSGENIRTKKCTSSEPEKT